MDKKKGSKKKRDKSLSQDFLSVEYPPLTENNAIPVRGGSRLRHQNDIELDQMLEKNKSKKK